MSQVEAREAEAAWRSACARIAIATRDAEALAADLACGLWAPHPHHVEIMTAARADLADAHARLTAVLAAVGGADGG